MNSLSYADIMEKTLQEAAKDQPRIQSIRIYPVCYRNSGHVLILATGWDKKSWINTILFHAHLVGQEITIEDDNFEKGLTPMLIAADIKAENIYGGIAKNDISTSS